MLKVQRCFCRLALAVALLVPSVAVAQKSPTAAAPPGPIPDQILNAKSVFIANLGTDYRGIEYLGTKLARTAPYDEFYGAVSNMGHFKLVSSPGQADIVLGISLTGSSNLTPAHLKLVILDPRTSVPLWSLLENIPSAGRKTSGQQAFTEGIARIVNDLKQLTSPQS